MPVLPQKRKPTGKKKSGDELQSELVEYMHDLLKIPKLQRMLYLRMFLSFNTYADITEETFNQLGVQDQSPILASTPDYAGIIESGRVSDRNYLLRESQDIDQLVQTTFSNYQANEELMFSTRSQQQQQID